MDGVHLVSITVAIIAGLSAVASQIASAKASGKAEVETSRVDMEKSAYERARAFDTETIIRQNKRIAELVREGKSMQLQVKDLQAQIEDLTARLNRVDHKDD